jgi:hypothetical protein
VRGLPNTILSRAANAKQTLEDSSGVNNDNMVQYLYLVLEDIFETWFADNVLEDVIKKSVWPATHENRNLAKNPS